MSRTSLMKEIEKACKEARKNINWAERDETKRIGKATIEGWEIWVRPERITNRYQLAYRNWKFIYTLMVGTGLVGGECDRQDDFVKWVEKVVEVEGKGFHVLTNPGSERFDVGHMNDVRFGTTND